jgi:hypothetical protein
MLRQYFNILKNFTITFFNPHLIFVYGCLSTIIFRLNTFFNLNINFFTLLGIIFFISFIIYVKIDFFSLKFKNNFYFNLFLYRFLDFKNRLYHILWDYSKKHFFFIEKLIICIILVNNFILFFYLIKTDFLYGFLNIVVFVSLLIFNLFNLLENYIIKNYFSSEEKINFINIQKKLKIEKVNPIFIKNNNDFNYIHYRYFSGRFTKEVGTKIMATLGSVSGITGVILYGTDNYHKIEDRKVALQVSLDKIKSEEKISSDKIKSEEKISLEQISKSFKQVEQITLEERENALAKLQDSSTFFSPNQNQKKVLEMQIQRRKENLEQFDKIAKDNNIDVVPKAFSFFEDFFF